MKKAAFIVFAVLVLFFVSAIDLAANQLNFRIGVITDKSFGFNPFCWTAGIDYDIGIVPHLWLDPEVYMIVQNFDFSTTKWAPGIMLNYAGYGFWFGAGITGWEGWRLGPADAASSSSNLALKLNASVGLIYDTTLTLFVVTPFDNTFQDMTLGVLFRF